jgi:hypothetical protein
MEAVDPQTWVDAAKGGVDVVIYLLSNLGRSWEFWLLVVACLVGIGLHSWGKQRKEK